MKKLQNTTILFPWSLPQLSHDLGKLEDNDVQGILRVVLVLKAMPNIVPRTTASKLPCGSLTAGFPENKMEAF